MAGKDYLKEGEGFIDITLSRQVTIGGAKVSALRMREPTVADQLAMDTVTGTDASRELNMVANLCEVAPKELEQLSLRDYKRVQSALLSFID